MIIHIQKGTQIETNDLNDSSVFLEHHIQNLIVILMTVVVVN